MASYNVVSNERQLSQAIIAKFEVILNKVADKVKQRVDEEIETYYAEYSPEIMYGMKTFYYDRTNQLRDCCKIKPIVKGLNSITVEIYLDIDSLSYSTAGADPWKTVVSADSGLHGGWEVKYGVATEQIPFGEIGDGSGYGETRIWHNPMSELLEGGKLKEMFLKYAKEFKLNLIAK